MKGGWKFFINLHNIAKAARAGIIVPLFFMLFLARGWFLMLSSLFLTILFVFVGFLPAPSDKKALEVLNKFYGDFDAELSNTTKKTGELFKCISGWKIHGRMRLKRSIDSKIIYPMPICLAISQKSEDRDLIICTMSMLKDKSTEHKRFKLSDCSISVSNRLGSDEETVLCILIPNAQKPMEILIENTHTNREFLQCIRGYI